MVGANRTFLWTLVACVFCLAALFEIAATVRAAPRQNLVDVKPSPQEVAWQQMEFGVILHFGTNTFLDREWGDGSADPKIFNPTEFNPEQWMAAIRAAGAKYVVMVAKHHDGFCLWPTGQTDYSVKSSPWMGGKGDVVGRVAAAAREYGLKFGVYLSPWDRHEPKYANSGEYDKYYEAELDELATNYGDLVEFWLDGAGSAGHVYDFAKYIEELREYQPHTLVFADMALFEYGDIRWVGNEDGRVPYENWNAIDRHGYVRWRPAEADTPLHKGHWFWHANDEGTLKSVDELLKTYDESVGRGAQLMLGVGPDKRGLLADADVARLNEFGAALKKRYANNLMGSVLRVHGAYEAALDGDAETFWAAPAEARSATIEVNFSRPVRFNRAVTMEWLNEGQHVERYRVECWDGKGWTSVAEGEAIGHKKIDTFAPVTASRVRLNVVAAAGAIRISEFQLYRHE